MFDVLRPPRDEIERMQLDEGAFYWSHCAEMLLEKHGLRRGPEGDPASVRVVLRGAPVPADPSRCVIEGPRGGGELAALGLSARTFKTIELPMLSAARAGMGFLVYPKFSTKRIPSARGEVTEPRRHVDPDPRWWARPLRVQFFDPAPGWEPVLFGQTTRGLEPIAVTDGQTLVIGFSALDIIGFTHAMPPLEDGFFRSIRTYPTLALERWLRDHVLALAHEGAEALLDWPEGHHACLSIRHDYDRPISDGHLEVMLRFYERRGIKATWFLLDGKKAPPVAQARAMVDAGHEIALHTIAPDFETMRAEAARFGERYGVEPRGFTCHGGIGSRGHLALNHNRWAARLGMIYGEFIGRCRGLPHPVIDPASGVPEPGGLILHNCHHSLDLTTRPEDHQLEFLSKDVPRTLANGEHDIVMNHPDIHWPELRTLLGGLDLSGVWCATFEEVAAWSLDRGRRQAVGAEGARL